MRYNFFYDETEHSRKINYDTIMAENYYDNFTTAIVGWNIEKEGQICSKYIGFETKYDYRKRTGN